VAHASAGIFHAAALHCGVRTFLPLPFFAPPPTPTSPPLPQCGRQRHLLPHSASLCRGLRLVMLCLFSSCLSGQRTSTQNAVPFRTCACSRNTSRTRARVSEWTYLVFAFRSLQHQDGGVHAFCAARLRKRLTASAPALFTRAASAPPRCGFALHRFNTATARLRQ